MPILQPVPGTTVYIWNYVPNLPASIIFTILFSLESCLLGIRTYKTKSWFCLSFLAGCIMEVVGYIARASAYGNTGGLVPYTIQACFILLPPCFFAASIYMTLARVIRTAGAENLSVIRPEILAKVFVWSDISSIGIQGSVSGLSVHPQLVSVMTAMVLLGLAMQLISFILFFLCAVIFHLRFGTQHQQRPYPRPEWLQTLYMLYAVSVLIFIRSVFRIVEYGFGTDGYPLRHEWTLYTFDSVPMAIVAGVFWWWFPSVLVTKGGIEEGEGMRLASRAFA